MSSFNGYKTTAFKETQKFFVLDPATGSPSFVQGSDLVSYLRPSLNSVDVETTTDAAVNANYDVGKVIQTTGESAPGDGNPGLFLVVAAGTGGIPMLNGNELLVLEGANTALGISYDNTASGYSATNVQEAIDNFAVNTAGEGSDLIAHTGTSDTVTDTLDRHDTEISERTIFVGSVAELETLSVQDGSFVDVRSFWQGFNLGGGTFVWDASRSKTEHDGGFVIDPDKISELVAPGSFGTYFTAAGSGTGCFVRRHDVPNAIGTIGQYGAVPDDTSDSLEPIQQALDVAESKTIAGYIYAGIVMVEEGPFISSGSIQIPEKCGLLGVSTTGSRIKLQDSANIGTSGLVENKNKTGVGQEWFFLDKLNLDGNRGNGTTAGAVIKCLQIYVNSYIDNCLIGNSPGHGIWLLATPDEVSAGNGGPVQLSNNWVRVPAGHGLYVDGDFAEVNVYGGAFENPDAGFDCIHIDGTNYSGTRANAMILSPHFEFSNANSNGLYVRKAAITVNNLTSVGGQDATQYNVYVDTDVEFTMVGYKGSVGTRGGIFFADSGTEYDSDTYFGVVTNRRILNEATWYSSGAVGTDIDLDFNDNDIISFSPGSATTVADFVGTSSDKIYLRAGNGNVTIRNNANIKLISGADYTITSSNRAFHFIRISGIWFEVGATA